MSRSNDRLATLAWCVLGVLLLVLLSVIDYLTGPEVALSLYYFLILALIAWKTERLGITMGGAVTTSAVWLSAEWLTAGAPSTGVLLFNASSRLTILVAMGWMICRLKASLEAERAVARTDFVTGTLNARAFHEEARIEAERARRHGHPLTVAYLDLDNFKTVNDTYGHSRGNDVLRVVSETLKDGLRVSDRIARVGGDEFALLLADAGYEQGCQTVTRLQNALKEAMESHRWPVTFSIGVAVFETPASDVDSILRKADEMMYQAKSAGKDRFRVYSQNTPAGIHPIGVAGAARS